MEIGISCGRCIPARSTAVVELTIAFNSSAALLDRNSCQKRSNVLSSTMVVRTIIVLNVRSSGAAKITSVNNETMLTANSTPLKGVTNAWISCSYQVGGFSCVISLGPYCSNLCSTCSGVSPLRAVSSCLSASSGTQSHRLNSGEGRLVPRSFTGGLICSFMVEAFTLKRAPTLEPSNCNDHRFVDGLVTRAMGARGSGQCQPRAG